jgi:hypothetical protein
MAQFRQPDFTRGDPNTLGGYMAVHDRPAAFEGADGYSYSVDILADADDTGGWNGYLFFVKWARIGASAPEGHLESGVLARGSTEADARQEVGALTLNAVKQVLDELIASAPSGAPKRKWWDAMNAEDNETGSHGPGGGQP